MAGRVAFGWVLLVVASVACKKPGPKPVQADAESSLAEGTLKVGRLRWDASEHPLGILQLEPRLDWIVSTPQRTQKQTAYQVLIASDAAKLLVGGADVWDSGKVSSTDSINVRYGGPGLKARQRGFWTVRVWDKDDRASGFAAAAPWEVGPYDEDVEGDWVGRKKRPTEPAKAIDRSVVYLRKPISLPSDVRDVRLYASAFGLYEISINGKRVGDDVLAPGFTDYEKRVLMQTRDVTALLHGGDNVIGAIVGGGWCTAGAGGTGTKGSCGFEPPRIMVALEVTSADGSRQTIESDESWTYHNGPIVSSHLYDGETYDARLEMPGWNAPGFDAHDWSPVEEYDEATERNVYPDRGPPITISEDRQATSMTEPSPGVFVFDLGQSFVGWAKLLVTAPVGTSIALRYADALRPDGALNVENLRGAKATDRYIARGSGVEIWEPRFAVRHFRYVEVRGLPARPAQSAIIGRVVHSEMPQTGRLETSNLLVNQLFSNIMWSQRGAFLSAPTTGSERAERLGSMLEAQVFAMTSCLNGDVQRFYRKWIDDIRDAQHPNAAYSDAAPRGGPREGGPGAGSAGILIPWALHRCYADRPGIDLHLPSMGLWLELVRSKNPDLVWKNQLGADRGDPLEIGPATDHALLATAELSYMAGALAQMMRQGGPALQVSAVPYEKMSEGARAAFNAIFVLPDGRLKSDTQTAYAIAIAQGALIGDARDRASQHLVAAVERAGRHLTTGVLGTAYLLPALSMIGRDDLAYALLLQESCPSWLCSIKEGATTVSHLGFGAVGEWMYDAIGGIALDPRAPAGRHFLVRPRPGGGMTHARASYESLYGPISTDWSLEGGAFRLKVNVPAGSTATVTLPFSSQASESGVPLAKAAGVKVLEAGPNRVVADIESGRYEFAVVSP